MKKLIIAMPVIVYPLWFEVRRMMRIGSATLFFGYHYMVFGNSSRMFQLLCFNATARSSWNMSRNSCGAMTSTCGIHW